MLSFRVIINIPYSHSDSVDEGPILSNSVLCQKGLIFTDFTFFYFFILKFFFFLSFPERIMLNVTFHFIYLLLLIFPGFGQFPLFPLFPGLFFFFLILKETKNLINESPHFDEL